MAAALLFGLHSRPEAFIGLPSVIRDEVLLHLTEKHQAAQRDMMRASGEIRQIFGRVREVEKHSDEEVEEEFHKRLRDLSPLVEIQSVTEEDLTEAGRMVLGYRPPSSRGSQQYKDSVIWRVAIRAAKDNEVYLVTNDGGFYRGKDSDELADSLATEARELGRPVTLFRDVEALLQNWATNEPSLQTQELREIVTEAVAAEVSEVLPAHGGFIIQSCASAEIEVYLTEVHDQVSISGVFEYYLSDPEFSDAAEPPAVAQVRASATIGLDGPEVREVTLDNVRIQAITPHGEPSIANIVFGRAAVVIGVRYEPYRLREKLDLP